LKLLALSKPHILGREVAVAFISESCHPVIPAQW
jgi:hypothetical protein